MKRARLTKDGGSSSFCSSYNAGGYGGYKQWRWQEKDSGCDCGPPDGWFDAPLNFINFIDTHCHLEALNSCKTLPPDTGRTGYGGWWERSGADAVELVQHVLSRQPSELSAVISNCCDLLDFAWYEGLLAAWDSGEFKDNRFYFAVGVHPYCSKDFEDRSLVEPELEQRMLALASHPRCVAVGECGLDYCKAWETHEAQKRVFGQICRLAVRLKKPLVLHARDAARDTREILHANIPADWPIHLHGYTGEVHDAKDLLDSFSGLCIGFCGAITIPEFHGACNYCAPLWLPGCRFCGDKADWVKRDLDGLINAVPLDRLLLETDAPYMAPIEFGSKAVCMPWMAIRTAEHLAAKKGVTTTEVIRAANQNAERLYGVKFF